MEGVGKFSPQIEIDLLRIYEKVFKFRSVFFDNLEESVISKTGDDFETQMVLMEEIKEIAEKFDLYPGLSIIDMERIEQILDIFMI